MQAVRSLSAVLVIASVRAERAALAVHAVHSVCFTRTLCIVGAERFAFSSPPVFYLFCHCHALRPCRWYCFCRSGRLDCLSNGKSRMTPVHSAYYIYSTASTLSSFSTKFSTSTRSVSVLPFKLMALLLSIVSFHTSVPSTLSILLLQILNFDYFLQLAQCSLSHSSTAPLLVNWSTPYLWPTRRQFPRHKLSLSYCIVRMEPIVYIVTVVWTSAKTASLTLFHAVRIANDSCVIQCCHILHQLWFYTTFRTSLTPIFYELSSPRCCGKAPPRLRAGKLWGHLNLTSPILPYFSNSAFSWICHYVLLRLAILDQSTYLPTGSFNLRILIVKRLCTRLSAFWPLALPRHCSFKVF